MDSRSYDDIYEVNIGGYRMGFYPGGEYFVRVRALDGMGHYGPVSEPRAWVRGYPHAVLGAVQNLSVREDEESLIGDVVVSWDPAPGQYPGDYMYKGVDNVRVEWRVSGGAYSPNRTMHLPWQYRNGTRPPYEVRPPRLLPGTQYSLQGDSNAPEHD